MLYATRITSNSSKISITPEEFYLAEEIYQNLVKKSSDLIKTWHIENFGRTKEIQNVANGTGIKRWLINPSQKQL